MTTEAKSQASAQVFYDGSCPLCSREIAFYRARSGAEQVNWVDVSLFPTEELAPGLTKSRALARLHVLNGQGELVSGGAAFTVIWSLLPGFAWLARLFKGASMARALEWTYVRFLAVRQRYLLKS